MHLLRIAAPVMALCVVLLAPLAVSAIGGASAGTISVDEGTNAASGTDEIAELDALMAHSNQCANLHARVFSLSAPSDHSDSQTFDFGWNVSQTRFTSEFNGEQIYRDRIHPGVEGVSVGNALVVQWFVGGEPATAENAQVQAVRRLIGRTVDTEWTDVQPHMPYFRAAFTHIDDPEFVDASHNTTITYQVQLTEGRICEFVFLRDNRWTNYGIDLGGDTLGLWAPTGIFATDFEQQSDGIRFVAVPVGFALGGQLWLSSDWYLGFSGYMGWALATNEQPDETDDAGDSGFTVQTAVFGGILDLGGYVTVAPSYLVDFRSDYDDPGFIIGLGFGPRLTSFLTGGSGRE